MFDFRVMDNGQVMRSYKTGNSKIEEHFCMLTEIKKERFGGEIKVTILQFDETTKQQIVVSEILEQIPKEQLLQELKEEYLPQIKDTDLLGDTEEKERLQHEYLRKKTEIEAMT